jgi:large exoprotein involved in heme utilization and adhesion
MQTYNPIDGRKAAVVLLLLTTATPLFSQGTFLIGPSIRNGSFEDGVLLPWTTPGGNANTVQDFNFASHGEWYAVVSETAAGSIVRPSIFLRLNADRSDGLTFSLTLDARNGMFAFEGIRVFFVARNSDASYAFTENLFFSLPPTQWQDIQAQFQLPDAWDGGGNITLGLQFENYSASTGTTYAGYLDNIVLQQIPEPSVVSLLLAGAGALIYARHRTIKKRALA